METPAVQKFLDLIAKKFPTTLRSDIYAKGKEVYKNVGSFLSKNNCMGRQIGLVTSANEAIDFNTVAQATGLESFEEFITSCGVSGPYTRPCMEQIALIMDRCLGGGVSGAWMKQNARADHNGQTKARGLETLYPQFTANELNSHSVAGTEAFGTNIDMAVPDMKVAITVAIMNFHTGLVPRMFQTRTTAQPNVAYTKEYLEVYDLTSVEGFRKRLLELYFDPSLVRNELQKIVPRVANDSEGNFIVAAQSTTEEAFLKFGVAANIMKLSLQTGDAAKFGHTRINRTDIIAEGVRLDSVLVSIVGNGITEVFKIAVPAHAGRLTRMVNATDSAARNADVRFRAFLKKGDPIAAGTASTILAGLEANVEGIVVEIVAKPTISLKFGDVDCICSIKAAVHHVSDDDLLSDGAGSISADLAATALGYSIDARFSEENLRKTNIAIWSNRVPFSFDIPIGRNYVFDYAVGQVNAEENATNLTKVVRLGQDDVALKLIISTLEHVYDACKEFQNSNPVDQVEDPGVRYVAGDRVRPFVWQGSLNLASMNVIRDSDRSGDIKQKAISMLTAVTSRIIQKSLFQQQLNGGQVTFNVICSPEALGNVFSMPMIYQHFNKGEEIKESENTGGADYTLVLPNNVKLQFIISTFDYMQSRLVMFPTIAGNAESELNFAHNWDYGTMIAHYTPSAEQAHHRLFANIRELPIVVNPIGAIIDILGMEVANFLADENEIRPTFNVSGNIAGSTVVSGGVEITNIADTPVA